MSDTINAGGPDRSVAALYTFTAESLGQLCDNNAQSARGCGRYDHERIFTMLRSLFKHHLHGGEDMDDENKSFVTDKLAIRIVEKMYAFHGAARETS
jgi:WD repeat-containing protein 59